MKWKWEPVKDGRKVVVTPAVATISQVGKVEISTKVLPEWKVEDEQPVSPTDQRKTAPTATSTSTAARTPTSQLPSLDNATRKGSRAAPAENQDISEELDQLWRLSSRPGTQSKRI